MVLVEARILSCDSRLLDQRRDLAQRNDDSVLAVEGRDLRSICGLDVRALRQLLGLEFLREESKVIVAWRVANAAVPTKGRAIAATMAPASALISTNSRMFRSRS